MYFNDVHIIYYVVAIILGAITGKITNWINYRLLEQKKLNPLEFFRDQKKYKSNYLVIFCNIILYVLIVYRFGIQTTFIANLELIKYIILVPMILSVFVIDYKLQIIPNRLNLTIFETGLIIAFIYGWSNIAITINMLLGMVAGVSIFILITILSKLIFGKAELGFGDVKLMGALGLFFGLTNIVIVALISFLIGAILSIILVITKKKKTDEYMSFGPFIVISSIISILFPYEVILSVLIKIFTLGLYKSR